MTPKEFIISLDELAEFKMLLEDMLDGEDHIDRLLEIVNTVCSRPYNPQAEWDTVLDMVEQAMGFCSTRSHCLNCIQEIRARMWDLEKKSRSKDDEQNNKEKMELIFGVGL